MAYLKGVWKNKMTKSTGVTFGGSVILIIFGIILLSQSGIDATGVLLWSGLVCLFLGIGGIAVLILKELS